MIYRLVIKAEILPLATALIAYLPCQFNDALAPLISRPRFESIDFYFNGPKIMLFLQKQNCKSPSAGGRTQNPPQIALH